MDAFFLERDIQPHKVEGWIHTPGKEKKQFKKDVQRVCDLYKNAEELHKKGVHVMSCDEKTGIQALEKQITQMKSGHCERQDPNYIRNGTQCLIANLEVATGKIVCPTVGDTRTEEDFVAHIKQTIDTDPEGKFIFLTDNLNTHCSEGLVKLVAKACKISADLGIKGQSGVLKNMKTRANFLREETHRIRFVYTPKHASWLNQIECWFSTLVRRLLKRLSASSTEVLKQKILDFIAFFNATMAKPFKWTYSGKVLLA